MTVRVWQHRLDTCECPYFCRYGYSWVVEVDGVVVHHGYFTEAETLAWVKREGLPAPARTATARGTVRG